MRIAWLGPATGDNGGVPALGALLLEGALQESVEIDLFTTEDSIPSDLLEKSNLTIIRTSTWWRWGKWYSRQPMISFLSGMIARTQAHGNLCDMILERHRAKPYDCIFQISQCELFKIARLLNELPPIVVFPFVHAAGELRWHRREIAYARLSEPLIMHFAVRLMLRFRSKVQRFQMQKPAMIMGLSKRFNDLLRHDYGIPPERLKVLYHPIRTACSDVQEAPDADIPPSPMKLLFVSRISVRKGFDQIVELSKRLDDLHGKIQIDVIGGRTQWSDYTGHLKELNPRIARYLGSIHHWAMYAIYDGEDILLVPSMYEPGGLVVGEALSRGVSVVASDEVGSAEPISPQCCRRFPAGDVNAFEAATRKLIEEIRRDRVRFRGLARAQAKTHFSPQTVSSRLILLLKEAVLDKSPVPVCVAHRGPAKDIPIIGNIS